MKIITIVLIVLIAVSAATINGLNQPAGRDGHQDDLNQIDNLIFGNNVVETSTTSVVFDADRYVNLNILLASNKKRILNLKVQAETTIGALREILASKLSVPVDELIIKFNGSENNLNTLADSQILKEYEITSGSMNELIVDVKGKSKRVIMLKFVLNGREKFQLNVETYLKIKYLREVVSQELKEPVERVIMIGGYNIELVDSNFVRDYAFQDDQVTVEFRQTQTTIGRNLSLNILDWTEQKIFDFKVDPDVQIIDLRKIIASKLLCRIEDVAVKSPGNKTVNFDDSHLLSSYAIKANDNLIVYVRGTRVIRLRFVEKSSGGSILEMNVDTFLPIRHLRETLIKELKEPYPETIIMMNHDNITLDDDSLFIEDYKFKFNEVLVDNVKQRITHHDVGKNISLTILDWVSQVRWFDLVVNSEIPIDYLREIIASKLSAPIESIIMKSCGGNNSEILSDEHLLSSYKIENNQLMVDNRYARFIKLQYRNKGGDGEILFSMNVDKALPIEYLRRTLSEELREPADKIIMMTSNYMILNDSKFVRDYQFGENNEVLVEILQQDETRDVTDDEISKNVSLNILDSNNQGRFFFGLEVDPEISIEDLRETIADKLSAPIESIIMKTGGGGNKSELLSDEYLLSSYTIENNEIMVDNRDDRLIRLQFRERVSGELIFRMYVDKFITVEFLRKTLSEVLKEPAEKVTMLNHNNTTTLDNPKLVNDYDFGENGEVLVEVLEQTTIATIGTAGETLLVDTGRTNSVVLNIFDWFNRKKVFSFEIDSNVSVVELRKSLAYRLSTSIQSVLMKTMVANETLEDSHLLSDYAPESNDLIVEIVGAGILRLKFRDQDRGNVLFEMDISTLIPIRIMRELVSQKLKVPNVDKVIMTVYNMKLEDSKFVKDYVLFFFFENRSLFVKIEKERKN